MGKHGDQVLRILVTLEGVWARSTQRNHQSEDMKHQEGNNEYSHRSESEIHIVGQVLGARAHLVLHVNSC